MVNNDLHDLVYILVLTASAVISILMVTIWLLQYLASSFLDVEAMLWNQFITCEYHDPSAYSFVAICFYASNSLCVTLPGGMVSIWLMRFTVWNMLLP